MSEPRRDDPVIRFFAGAFIAIGWLVLALGGLCTLIIGAFSMGGGGLHARLGDWMLPMGMLASGLASLWIGLTIQRSAAGPVPLNRTNSGRDTDD